MIKAFLIKYSEIGLKGKNRYIFEDALVRNIRDALKKIDGEFVVSKERGRIYTYADGDFDFDETMDALGKVFGISGICPMLQVEDEGYDKLSEQVIDFVDQTYDKKDFTFKVMGRRARKNYPLNSMELAAELGGDLLQKFPELKVDVHKPEVVINVEVREHINIYSKEVPGLGGMPVGTSDKGMLLLSGGIDSPVAGWMVAKRGVKVDAVYFHAPPYTSERAKQKVVDLAKQVSKYSGPMNLYVVNFTDIQLAIYEKCPHDELTIIMRRYMMKIAEYFAAKEESQCLITGESIGQVASQTTQSLAATNEVCTLPVFRPLIAFDKQDIIDISLKIDTYETSILPYEDCCTIFVAKHPVTKPNINKIKASETKLDDVIDGLFKEAVESVELIKVGE